MTLINSCCPQSLLHLIVLLTTIAITATSVPKDRSSQLDASETRAAGDVYDRKSDNKRYDNLFDFKTDVNNLLLLRTHGKLQASTISRKRRDTIASPLEASSLATPTPSTALSTENLILNLSFANLTSFSVNFSAAICETVAVVNLSHNSLSQFNASKLTKLKALDLSHNLLSDFHLGEHGLLRTLDASENSLTEFECADCKGLQALNLSHNQLSNISLDNLPMLTAVDLSSNELSILEPALFHNKSNLSDVRLACNRIRAIEKDFFHELTGLRMLDLSFNDISDIDSETFGNLVNLQVFDLSFNRIHIASLQSLQSIADLARLSLAGNVLLRNALRGFAVTWSIMELDYSHVGLCQVPDSLAQSVRILNLYGNFVNIICSGDFDSYPLLHKLVMANNSLTTIEDDALGRLEMLTILDLDNNRLAQIPSSLPASLIKLYMRANRLTDIKADDLINLINLELLDVSGNKIIYMPQLVLPSLITLSAKSCGLENVHRQISKTCPSLRHLLIEGNLIKCAELMEIEQCNENPQALANEYINDSIDYNQDDVEREERHLNSISHFPTDGGWQRCRREGRRTSSEGGSDEVVPNCWNEQKLITSFILTNDSTSAAAATTSPPDDNKPTKGSAKGKNDGNLSNETMRINNNATVEVSEKQPHNWQSSETLQNPPNKTKSAFPVDVARMEIKAENKSRVDSAGVNKNSSLVSPAPKGLMKTKQIKPTGRPLITEIAKPGLRPNAIIATTATVAAPSPTHPSNYRGADESSPAPIINRNLIDYVNGDYRSAQSLGKYISTNKTKAIKDNERANSTNHKSKSIGGERDNKSRNGGVNGLPLDAVSTLPEGIDATDHQQHMTINQTMNGGLQERWNDIRGESINHPGLLIVIAASAGLLLTFVVVYVYRCNFISTARRRRRRGSCETINEGRDVLSDNFNEETHSFTIETHNHCESPLTAAPSAVNQCDLLPMDILNSTLSQSVDQPHISMHLW